MAPLWSWLGALLALPLALAGKSGDAVPKSYIVEFSGSQIVSISVASQHVEVWLTDIDIVCRGVHLYTCSLWNSR